MADIVLVPGFWLGGWAWDRVAGPLREAGNRVWQVTLPGLESVDAPRAGIRLDDHIDAVVGLVRRENLFGVVLVAHSGGGSVAYGAADRMPERVARGVYVDSGPLPDGTAVRPDLGPDEIEIPLPSWDQMQASGSSLAGLSEADLAEFRTRAVPHPAGPARDPLRLTNEARREVPVTLVDCSMSSDQVRHLTSTGMVFFIELQSLDVTHVDLPTGHWPMFSRPDDLAAVLAEIAAAPAHEPAGRRATG